MNEVVRRYWLLIFLVSIEVCQSYIVPSAWRCPVGRGVWLIMSSSPFWRFQFQLIVLVIFSFSVPWHNENELSDQFQAFHIHWFPLVNFSRNDYRRCWANVWNIWSHGRGGMRRSPMRYENKFFILISVFFCISETWTLEQEQRRAKKNCDEKTSWLWTLRSEK